MPANKSDRNSTAATSAPQNPKPYVQKLAGRLQAVRFQKGWDMNQVAAAAGISRTTLFHLERGKIARPRASTLHKIAQAVAIPIEALVAATFDAFPLEPAGARLDAAGHRRRGPAGAPRPALRPGPTSSTQASPRLPAPGHDGDAPPSGDDEAR